MAGFIRSLEKMKQYRRVRRFKVTMKNYLLPILVLLTSSVLGASEENRIEYDFNFDGYMDYCVSRDDNSKGTEFDVFVFEPSTSTYLKNETLSGKVFPRPDKKAQEVRCIFYGGHSGALYSGEVYRWNGSEFEFSHFERQEYLKVNGTSGYVRVKVVMDGETPVISSIESVDPHS